MTQKKSGSKTTTTQTTTKTTATKAPTFVKRADLVRATGVIVDTSTRNAARVESSLTKRIDALPTRDDIRRVADISVDTTTKMAAQTDANVNGWGEKIMRQLRTMNIEVWTWWQCLIILACTVAGGIAGKFLVFDHMVKEQVRPFARIASSVTKAVADNAGNIKYYRDVIEYVPDKTMMVVTIIFFSAAAFALSILVLDWVKYVKVRK